VRRSDRRAGTWDAEEELVAISFLGDVIIGLSRARTTPTEITIEAWALLRDIEVVVPESTRVDLGGDSVWGDLDDQASAASEDGDGLSVRVHGHVVVGDATVRAGNL